jgi:hypothetical protein
MEEKKEIELIDYLDVIWRKKFLIVIPTFLLMIMAGYCSFRTPLAYAADAIIAPSSIMLETPGGRLEKIQLVDPLQLAIQINQGSYNANIADALNLDTYEIGGIRAENLRDPQSPQYLRGTDLVLVSTMDLDMDKAERILNQLYQLVKEDLDAKAEIEAQAIDSRLAGHYSRIKEKEVDILENKNQMEVTAIGIKDKDQEIKVQENEIVKKKNTIHSKKLEIESVEIEKTRIGDEIKSLQNKIKLFDKREKELQAELEIVNARIKQIEEQQSKALAAKKTEDQAISLLLYSTEIQSNLRFSNDLDDRRHDVTVERENCVLEIHLKEELLKQRDNKILQIEAQIATIQADIEDNKTQIDVIRNQSEKIKKEITTLKNANEKIRAEIQLLESEINLQENQKARISRTELIKPPGPSMMPVGRNPLYMVIIVGFICFMMFTILAFFIDYIQKHKKPRSA